MRQLPWHYIFFPLLYVFLNLHLHAQAQTSDSSGSGSLPDESPLAPELTTITRVEYDLPLYDSPYSGLGGYAFPSMTQSLAMTKNIAQGIHWVFARYGSASGDRASARLVRSFGFALSEIALISLPGGYSWLHEEWHCAVLKNYGINSHDGVYDFRILSSVVPVSHVADESLSALKYDHPADMVRLSAAGIEGQLELVRSLRKELFFNRQECSLDWITLFINTFSPASYVFLCSLPYADQLINEIQKAEGADISKRDIVGMDFTAWVYDLFRPHEPYGMRGIHPSGVGIDRYIKRSKLTDNEKNYLQLQGILAWLNLINPQLFLKNRFSGTNPLTHTPFFWNAGLVHELTPFGFTIDCDVLARTERSGFAFTLHSYFSRNSYYPGVSVEVDDFPFTAAGTKLYWSGLAEAWLQPRSQMFDDRSAKAGGFVSAELKAPLTRNLLLSASVSGKSAGWKAGDVSLGRSYGFALGLNLWLPNRQ